jgi:cytochrome b561|tara:strand:- start:797 stop:928 length:132 start_codon:yes stop_codon:yes gene_type:complete
LLLGFFGTEYLKGQSLMLGAHVIGALKHHYIDQHKAAFKRMVS